MGIVYIATNILNNKSYIGKTVYTLEYRKTQHKNASIKEDERFFYRAIRKNGFENFKWGILFESEDNNLLLEKEVEFIKNFNTYGQNGYNLTLGGQGSLGRILTEETKNKISAKALGRPSNLKGKTRTEEEKLKISKTRKLGILNGKIINANRKLTIEQVAEIRTAALNNASVDELASKFEVTKSVIYQVIRGRMYKREIKLLGIPEIPKYNHKKALNQSQEETILRLFSTGSYSRSCLARAFGVSISVVCNLLKRKISSLENTC